MYSISLLCVLTCSLSVCLKINGLNFCFRKQAPATSSPERKTDNHIISNGLRMPIYLNSDHKRLIAILDTISLHQNSLTRLLKYLASSHQRRLHQKWPRVVKAHRLFEQPNLRKNGIKILAMFILGASCLSRKTQNQKSKSAVPKHHSSVILV